MYCEICLEKENCKKTCKTIGYYFHRIGIYSSDWIRHRISPKRAKKEGKGCWREIPLSALPSFDREKDPILEDTGAELPLQLY